MRKVLNAFGIRPNGTPTTFQGQYRDILKMLAVVVSVAFTLGVTTMGFRGLPTRMDRVEAKQAELDTEVKLLKSYAAQNCVDHSDVKNDLQIIKKILMERGR